MDKKVNPIIIAYLNGIDNDKDIYFTDNILLTQTSEKDRDNFNKYSNFQSINRYSVSNCLKFTLDAELIIVREENTINDVETYVMDAAWQLVKIIDAINIVKKEPCNILRIDVNNGDEYMHTEDWIDFHHRYYYKFKNCVISNKDVHDIMKINDLLLKTDINLDINSKDIKKYWWFITIEYYLRYTESPYIADQIIDLTIALESLLSGSEDAEMRYRFSQRASLYLYSIAGYYPNHIQKIIKKLYDLRSKVVHGSTALKSLENEIIKIGNEKIEFENGVIEFKSNHIDLSSALVILREIIRQMLFDALLNHSNKSKTMFLEYIDNSWYELKDISKFKLIDENIIKYSTKNY